MLENGFSLTYIFPYDSVLIQKNMSNGKPIFWYILHSEKDRQLEKKFCYYISYPNKNSKILFLYRCLFFLNEEFSFVLLRKLCTNVSVVSIKYIRLLILGNEVFKMHRTICKIVFYCNVSKIGLLLVSLSEGYLLR